MAFFVVTPAAMAARHMIETLPLTGYLTCEKVFTEVGGPFQPYSQVNGPNKLYQMTSAHRWELDDYGPVYRYSTLNLSVSENLLVEEYIPALDMGPSRMWIQSLQGLGLMPPDLRVLQRDPRGLRWSDVDDFMAENGLDEHTHFAREAHLETQRLAYARAVAPAFQFALSQYPRRAWFTPDFRVGAQDTFEKTLRNASYILLRDRATRRPIASMRLVQIHNGLVRLKHKKTGRVLEVVGNAEYTWGVDGKFRTSKQGLIETHELDKFVPAFLRSGQAHMKVTSEYDPAALMRLPMEDSLHIDLPRNWQMMDLRGQSDFGHNPSITIGGEDFEVSYGHAVLVEPGLFAIEKSADRGKVFVEMSIWLGRYLSSPPLPGWVDARSVAYWTYNDLPLYVIFGFGKDDAFAPIHKYDVNWTVYSASVSKIQQALGKLAAGRTDDSDRARKLSEFLRQMAEKGL